MIAGLVSSPALSRAALNGELVDFFADFVDLYRRVFGGKGWREYLFCAHPDCAGRRSIAETFGSELINDRLDAAEINFDPARERCPECGRTGVLGFHWEPEALRARLRADFLRQAAGCFLLDERGKLRGFFHSVFSTLETIWETRLRHEFSEFLSLAGLMEGLAEQGVSPKPDDPVCYFSDWGALMPRRNRNAAFELLRQGSLLACRTHPEIEHLFAYCQPGRYPHRVLSSLGARTIAPAGAPCVITHHFPREWRQRMETIRFAHLLQGAGEPDLSRPASKGGVQS